MRQVMNKFYYLFLLLLLNSTASAETVSFNLSIQGGGIDVSKTLELSDVGEGKTEINFDLKDANGKKYVFDLQYKKLPSNRSYPSNIDITFKEAKGDKLGYLFFANNGVKYLKKMGVLGLIVDVAGEPVDIKLTFDQIKKGKLSINDLGEERFVQDTLVSKFNFQMIRPVILPNTAPGVRSQTYTLDSHPYAVNYTIKDLNNGAVQFQHNLYQLRGSEKHLLERVYFNAASIEILREAMFAGKYFSESDGAFKLVFYPAMGQTKPPESE